jgi:putative FmdB family regulatory protein
MPIYDFKCEKCDHKFEAITSIDSKFTLCPKCDEVAERDGVPLTGGHSWGCSSEGAEPKGKRR